MTEALSFLLDQALQTVVISPAEHVATYVFWSMTPTVATLMMEIIVGFNRD